MVNKWTNGRSSLRSQGRLYMVLWVVQNDPFLHVGVSWFNLTNWCDSNRALSDGCSIKWLASGVQWQCASFRGISLGDLDSIWFGNGPILMLWFNSISWLVKLVLWKFLVGSFRGSGPCAFGSWCSVPVLVPGAVLVVFLFVFGSCSWSCSGSGASVLILF